MYIVKKAIKLAHKCFTVSTYLDLLITHQTNSKASSQALKVETDYLIHADSSVELQVKV